MNFPVVLFNQQRAPVNKTVDPLGLGVTAKSLIRATGRPAHTEEFSFNQRREEVCVISEIRLRMHSPSHRHFLLSSDNQSKTAVV